jgi:septum formation protein
VTEPVLHLASASPRRREILRALGVSHSWRGVGVDETPLPEEGDADLVLRLALAKARAARQSRSDGTPVLGADTIVSLDGRLFGKAGSQEEALFMLERLSGRTHRVLTAIALSLPGREFTALSQSEVRMREIPPGEARAYWATGEPAGKAGAYAIQGIGGVFVESLAGSWSGVVGLPVFETAALLKRAGIDVVAAAAEARS